MERPFRVIAIDNPPEDTRAGLLDTCYQLVIHENPPVPDCNACSRILQLRKTSYIYLVPDAFIIGPDLTVKSNLTAAKGAAGAKSSSPDAVKTQQLPDGINTEATRLNRVTRHVALKIPGIQSDVLLSYDETLSADALA